LTIRPKRVRLKMLLLITEDRALLESNLSAGCGLADEVGAIPD
jgi:hypothetical protein